MSIFIDSKDNMWLGTGGGGLIQFNYHNNTLVNIFDESQGLCNNTVYSISEDKKGFLWLNTSHCITRFHPNTSTFLDFNESDGSLNAEFNPGAAFFASNGNYYYGGTNGITYFNPDSIILNTKHSPIVITDLKIFNKSVKTGEKDEDGKIILIQNINEIREITLSHYQNFFTLEFAALEYNAQNDLKYVYLLEGFNDDWIETDAKHRSVTFTNIPFGQYLFKVKVKNEDGFWNEEPLVLKINILPAFWETWWFIVLSLLYIVGLIFGILWIRKSNAKKRQALILRLINEKTAAFEEEKSQLLGLTKFKDQWYHNLMSNVNAKVEKQIDGSVNEKLLEIFSSAVLAHLSNPNLDVDMLAKELGMSRTHLYSKLKSLTGISVRDFIEGIRMSQAAILLSSQNGTIAEIAEMVGFSDASYFGKCFRKHFGMTPSEFISANQK